MMEPKLDDLASLSTPRVMTKEEEDEWEMMVRQRRSRGGGFYGGAPPHPSTLEADFVSRSSGLSEPGCSKSFEKIARHSTRFKIGYADTIGRRPTMEDEIRIMGKLRDRDDEDYVAIFDGPGGRDVAEFAARNLHQILEKKLNQQVNPEVALKESFLEVNELVKTENISGGSTALVSLILKDKIYIANAGDSRAVLLRDDKTIRITTDHKPDIPEEEERIVKSGGMVTKVSNKQGKTISRVNGMLAVSRAIGDIFLQPYVTSEPQIHQIDLSENNRILILACDGLWDVLNDDEATSLALEEENPEDAAIKLRDTALSKGSADNISAIVIKFPSTNNSKIPTNIEPSPKAPPFVGGWNKSTSAVIVVMLFLIGAIYFRYSGGGHSPP